MTSLVISCKMCKTPLNDREQFIGHHIHSHELSIHEATRVWHLLTGPDSGHYLKSMGGRKL